MPKWAHMLNKANSVREGMMLLSEMVPHVYYQKGAAIKSMLAERIGTPQPKLFSLDDFNKPALNLDMPIVLHGDTAYCKTAFAKAHFDNALIVRRPDDLKRIAGPTDGTYIHTHAYTYTYMHACVHACMHACIHTYIHTYNTHIHMYRDHLRRLQLPQVVCGGHNLPARLG